MDIEQPPSTPNKTSSNNRRRRRTRNVCICLASVVLTLSLLILILALTVFKVKHPVETINSVTLSSLDFSLDIARIKVNLNITLDVDVSIKNPNRVGFRYENTTTLIRYRGQEVGHVPIPGGYVGPRQTKPMNLTLVLVADRMLSSSALFSDVVLSGALPLKTYMKVYGKVKIVFDFHVVSYSTCDLKVSIVNRNVTQQECHYKNKI